MKKLYDCIIIGGGPAGLTAGIYLGLFNRSVLIIEKASGGRWNTFEKNQNYFGFPEGIHTKQLIELGRQQALQSGAEIKEDEVVEIIKLTLDTGKDKPNFRIETINSDYKGKTVILATGVRDIFPAVNGIDKYIGKSVFWCITCDGCKTIDKKIAVIGQDNEAASTALQFLNFTQDITFITNAYANDHSIDTKYLEYFKQQNISLTEGCIESFNGSNGFLKSITLDTKQVIEVEVAISHQSALPNNELIKSLGVKVDTHGYILTDGEQRTNIPRLYAAGDITKLFSHQIGTAVHEGSTAAQAANYDLYEDYQK